MYYCINNNNNKNNYNNNTIEIIRLLMVIIMLVYNLTILKTTDNIQKLKYQYFIFNSF